MNSEVICNIDTILVFYYGTVVPAVDYRIVFEAPYKLHSPENNKNQWIDEQTQEFPSPEYPFAFV